MRLDGLVAPEGALHDEKLRPLCEGAERIRVACVRGINERDVARIRQAQGQALARVRRRERTRMQARQQLELRARRDLAHFDGKGLLEEIVIARIIERAEQSLQSVAAVDRQWLASALRLRRMFRAEEERGQPADVVKVKVADPDGIQLDPVEILLGHTMNGGGARIEQDGARRRIQPVSGGCALRVWNGSA